MRKISYKYMNGEFGVNIEKCADMNCIVVVFLGSPQSFDQIKKNSRKLGEALAGFEGKANLILDFSSMEIGVEFLRFFLDHIKQNIDGCALEWCSVSPRQMEQYFSKGLNYVMKQEKPVFHSIEEAKGWIDNIVNS